ncbi:MAG: hypothetical protein AUG88_04040 [Actinobacteria bacterium 13_1_20CM_4_68_12]|nr:MAG: hypothetical protein AUG88_04040 [Actinobacteria bacterium 13_1_20CM_4_68_12]
MTGRQRTSSTSPSSPREDLQLTARDLLREHDEIRQKEAWRFRAVMVDEFQDTNRLQCDVIDLIAGDELFFVGDEFQSIYGFRHADVNVFRERREEAGSVLPLTLNYRSRPEVLAAVNHLFGSDFGDEFQPLAASGDFPDPVFGTPVELLVTDKASYTGTGTHWRRGEARSVARRVKELVDTGAAKPGEIVLLFAAGTDAEWYEQELRELGLPTYRTTGRGYFGQQQVADLLAYLRLLHNRYDDEALVTVLASPLVGVSNDALVLLRRAASKRPLFKGLERALPEGLDPRDARLFQAFRQRFERLVAASRTLSLERLCEEIVAAHDYDLAVLAQWDGRRRYANLRKLARLARSYEELRGADIEGFVRFVREQGEAGAKELEAVAEEEDADVIRLLTIHAAKGLEFKVVVVADAGRDRAAPGADEILALPDGRFGFRVADPATGVRKPTTAYEEVRAASREEAEAERRRLYYVAMTRAVDRLIVAGSIDPEKGADERTPIGWVLGRLEIPAFDDLADGPVELEREGARILLRLGRFEAEPTLEPLPEPAAEPAQLALFEPNGSDGSALVTAPKLPPLEQVPEPPLHRVRTLSYSALALFESCSYRYYAERVAGMREAQASGSVPGHEGLAATEIGDSVHFLLEALDLRDPRPPEPLELAEAVRARYPAATDEELERIAGLVRAYCDSELATRIAALEGAAPERPFAFEHDRVLLHGRLDVLHLDGPRAVVVDYKTNVLEDATPEELRASSAPSCPGSKRSFRRRSRGSRRACSSRRRASSSAPAVRFSTSSARGRGCGSIRRSRPRSQSASRRAAELRPRGAAPRRPEAGADRADHRAARGRPSRRENRAPLPERARAARLGDALGADDRRERQSRHRAVVREVQAAGGLPGRPAGGARARHLRDRLLPPEGEGAARDDGNAARGVRRPRAAQARRPHTPARRCAEDGERGRGGARRSARDRRRHACAPAVPALGADKAGGPGQDRARSAAARPARVLGALPAPADLARTPCLHRPRAPLRGLRRQRPLPLEPGLGPSLRCPPPRSSPFSLSWSRCSALGAGATRATGYAGCRHT